MKQLIVTKDGWVVAVHRPDQAAEIADAYPGCEIFKHDGPKLLPTIEIFDENGEPTPESGLQRTPDPRLSKEQ